MAKKKKMKYRFVVHLYARQGRGPEFLEILGNSMIITNGGILEIVDIVGPYGQNHVVAAFKSGTWFQCNRLDNDKDDTNV